MTLFNLRLSGTGSSIVVDSVALQSLKQHDDFAVFRVREHVHGEGLDGHERSAEHARGDAATQIGGVGNECVLIARHVHQTVDLFAGTNGLECFNVQTCAWRITASSVSVVSLSDGR